MKLHFSSLLRALTVGCLLSTASWAQVVSAPTAVTTPFATGGAGTATVPAGSAAAVTGATNAAATGQGSAPPGTPNLNALLPGQAPALEIKDANAAPDGGRSVPRARQLPTNTGFQRFVQESTGQMLPLFGYELFAEQSFNSLRDVPVPADYVIGPGDEIRLQIWGAVDGNLSLVVDRNGQISIPKVGVINVAGLKESQLESVLRANVGRYFNNFQLNSSLGKLRSMQVFVVGQAQRPGTFTVSGLSTVLSVLFESGGPSATGSMRNIQLKRAGKPVATLDLYSFINEGDKTGDVRLLPGDVVVIPPAGTRVALLGSLDRPAIYELKGAEEPLGKLLAYAGRTSVLTTPHKVLLERVDHTQPKSPRRVEDLNLSSAGLGRMLKDGDVVRLLGISPEIANAVTLRGNVAAPLRYPYRPGMRVSDLIPERDALIQGDYYKKKNMTVQYDPALTKVNDQRLLGDVKTMLNEINWDYASIERLNKGELRTQLIPFNLAIALSNPASSDNIELLPGDVVTVFGINELPISIGKKVQYVNLSGEVNAPGVYQISPGETIPDLVARAGGLTRYAYAYGATLTRESTRVQQQKNLDQAIQRMEADMNSQALTYAQNTKADSAGQLRETYIQGQRGTIARLSKLRSSGRIAMEMDYRHQSFPPLALEDLDALHIPARSNFVSVFGAVMSESSYIHREGSTVRDYINRSGLTREADDEYVVILRADGSAETDYQSARSWFGRSNVMSRLVYPGDAIFVPEKIDRRTAYNKFIDGAKDWTAIFYQFGLGAASIKLIKN